MSNNDNIRNTPSFQTPLFLMNWNEKTDLDETDVPAIIIKLSKIKSECNHFIGEKGAVSVRQHDFEA